MRDSATSVNLSLLHRLETVAARVAQEGAACSSESSLVGASEGPDCVEAIMAAEVLRLRPRDGLFGEADPGETGIRWLLDAPGGDEGRYVSVGVEIEGHAMAGVVFDRRHGAVYTGSVASPARRDGRVVRVRGGAWRSAVLATGFSSSPGRHRAQRVAVERLLDEVRDVRLSSSPALELCRVAAGLTSAFFQGPLHRQKASAGIAIVRAAGGTVGYVFDGEVDVLVAGPRRIVDEMRRILAQPAIS